MKTKTFLAQNMVNLETELKNLVLSQKRNWVYNHRIVLIQNMEKALRPRVRSNITF